MGELGVLLAGDWWCAWQTWKDGAPRIDTHPLKVHQQGELLTLDAERAIPLEEGSYRWRGELRLWDNEALIGWYHIDCDDLDPAVEFWSAALDATEQALPERSRHIYRHLRLPDSEIRVLLQRTNDAKVSKERMHPLGLARPVGQ